MCLYTKSFIRGTTDILMVMLQALESIAIEISTQPQQGNKPVSTIYAKQWLHLYLKEKNSEHIFQTVSYNGCLH